MQLSNHVRVWSDRIFRERIASLRDNVGQSKISRDSSRSICGLLSTTASGAYVRNIHSVCEWLVV